MDAEEEPSSPHMAQYQRLIALYGITADRRVGWLNEMAETFDAYPVEAVERAVNRYRKDYAPPPGAFVQVPPPGSFAGLVFRATEELEAEAAGQRTPSDSLRLPASEATPALPGPTPAGGQKTWKTMSGPERAAFFERHLAIGKLRAHGVVEPTEQEIAGMVGQMRATRFCHKTLEAIAEREDAPLADVAGEVTGVWPR